MYVKEAAKSKDFSPGKDWAHPCKSELPVTTPADTWMSAVYLYGADAAGEADEFFKVAETNIVKAASRHHCFADIMDVKAAAAVAKKPKALEDSDFAVIVKVAGAPQRRFPLYSCETVKKSAKVFHTNRMQYGFSARTKIAARLLEKAAQLNADLPRDTQIYLEKAACLYPTSPDELVQRLRVRASFFRGEDERAYQVVGENAGEIEKYAEVAPVLASMEEESPIARRLIAEGTLPLLEEVFFRPEPVKAASSNTVTLQTGETFDIYDMTKAGAAPFAAAGDVYLDAVTSDGSVIDPEYVRAIAPTIPRDDAATLSDALKIAGVMPVNLEKAAKMLGASAFDRGRLADDLRKAGKTLGADDYTIHISYPYNDGSHKRAALTTLAGILD